MILGGKSCKTSSFKRRRMKGKTCRWRDSIANTPEKGKKKVDFFNIVNNSVYIYVN